MLQLKHIAKTYEVGTSQVMALQEINVDFRPCEFVSILGPSGCGKTTLLNLIGGLDRYTDGDLIINGRSTTQFSHADWDTYRNHRIGFVFQNYNLIPHQTVLANVELALTLSGISRAERHRRAMEALEKVGLADQIRKKPNQLSGGQMQRVAIARAIVNDPEILLADEPTGALDSTISLQVMDLLKEIARDRLVIMVTHNADLAQAYSTRILHLMDGRVVDDSHPFHATEEPSDDPVPTAKTVHPSMSLRTAFSLSLRNLMTKKGRTMLTAIAGSIGIIGIALILALSHGANVYIDRMQTDTLSSYPIQLEQQALDVTTLISRIMNTDRDDSKLTNRDTDLVYSNHVMSDVIATMSHDITANNLGAFKTFIETDPVYGPVFQDPAVVSDVQYRYDLNLDIYTTSPTGTIVKVNPNDMLQGILQAAGLNVGNSGALSSLSSLYQFDTWAEMLDNPELLDAQYELLDPDRMHWPQNYDEIVIVVNQYNELSDISLYSLGLKDPDEFKDMILKLALGETIEEPQETSFTFDDLMNLRYRLILPSDYYVYDEKSGTYVDKSQDQAHLADLMAQGIELKVVGIVRARETSVAASIDGTIGYTRALTNKVIGLVREQSLVQQQLNSPDVNVLDGLVFDKGQFKDLSVAGQAELFRTYAAQSMSDYDKQRAFFDLLSALTHDEKMAIVETFPDEVRDALIERDYATVPSLWIIQYVLDNFMLYETAYRYIVMDAIDQALTLMTPEQKDAFLAYIDGMTEDELLELVMQQAEETPADGQMTLEEKRAFLMQHMMKLDRAVLIAYAEAIDTEKSILDLENAGIPSADIAAMFDACLDQIQDEIIVSHLYDTYMPALVSDQSYQDVLSSLGCVDPAQPNRIYLYAAGFEAKEQIQSIIEVYNLRAEAAGQNRNVIRYTDLVGSMMTFFSDTVTTMSYLLVAFVSVSLVVSSLMIGIITYVSVLERTREIGILRAMGASRRDIARVFNAETAIIGLAAGLFGIVISLLLCIPINVIIYMTTHISGINVTLPLGSGLLLVIISVILTLIAGLIPAITAAKKDPVVALRSE